MSSFPLFRKALPFLYWSPTVFFLSDHFFHVKTISGRSMQPTLNPDSSQWRDVALFSKFAVREAEDYGRDDIVTVRSPQNPKYVLIKRIIAMEGDTVKTLPPYPDLEVTVPEGHVWIEGDEHFVSDDSNHYGPVSKSLIESKLLMIIWPPNRFGTVSMKACPPQEGHPLSDEQRREINRHARVHIPPIPSSTSDE
ncbi:Mitochondrial inner membrane protease subunit 2 [Psilocybe cubensis]|uniref:Mitochondrial inner membrane protease subunit n=2 Tax=Psilocybe cubensis TaxID=181762 RepID=A0A8H8CK21_PSICU|nr:Mitochondrial inner membrane protease subunit 2 [Psilocybe cubensis]KAH9482804.1 Mitochondrial inner membrane protease subunit 2 [Psilocybe cubensis]